MKTSERAETFDALYRADPDPWHFTSSEYERVKRGATLDALPEEHFPCALEVGCSIGNLAAELASRCGSLLAIDVSEVALSQARARCQRGNVIYRCAEIPQAWPGGTYDLIVFSEVLYFLNAGEVRRSSELAFSSLASGGTVLLVNWIGPTDTALTGDDAAEVFLAGAGDASWRTTRTRREASYRIDVLHAVPSDCQAGAKWV